MVLFFAKVRLLLCGLLALLGYTEGNRRNWTWEEAKPKPAWSTTQVQNKVFEKGNRW